MPTEAVVAARLTSERSGHFQKHLLRQEYMHNSVTVDIFERDRKHLMVNAQWTASLHSIFPLHPQASN